MKFKKADQKIEYSIEDSPYKKKSPMINLNDPLYYDKTIKEK